MPSWRESTIEGVFYRYPVLNSDERGFLVEAIREDEVPVKHSFRMSYISCTAPGFCRGPHEHLRQTDLFAFSGRGFFLIRLWDNRRESRTYKSFLEITGGGERPLTLIIPPGVVHGYKNISETEDGYVVNYPDQLYKGWLKKERADEIRHENGEGSSFTMD
jgi:dTDP-4-dehydrorhamnose 3,5-epimerase